MPLKLVIAASRKIGTANYGSRGATVGLEIEVDGSLLEQPEQLQERIASLFQLAAESVHREEGRAVQGLGPTDNQGAGRGGEVTARQATANQIRALHAITNRQDLDLTAELRSRFGVYRADDLTLEQASQLIDIFTAPN